MRIKILTVGKPENQHYKALIELYLKRIKHYTTIEYDYIKPERIAKLSESEILNKEKERLLKKLDPKGINIVLNITGKTFSSKSLAVWFQKQQFVGQQSITFIIGGPHGLSKEIIKAANSAISFSQMTFPHELAAVMLLEQIYRAHTILKGEKYHK